MARDGERSTANAVWIRALQRTAGLTPSGTRTLAAIVEERAAADPQHPALIGEEATLSYGELDALSARCAAWALTQGLRPGDRVALLMRNAPAYPAIWLGLSRVGIVTALINTQLVGAGLGHCLAAAAATHIITDAEGARTLDRSDCGAARIWTFGASVDEVDRLEDALPPPAALDNGARRAPTLRDPALLIFTSGTTGLPKAAWVSHFRIVMWSEWFAAIMNATPQDRLYDCLPMYHSIGGVVTVGAMLAAGGTTIVRRTFSASGFWPDVAASRATIFQYIGELCRFLVDAPPTDMAPTHALRLICGNGLREPVWRAFVARFAIPRVIEFYAATEASFSLFNLEGQPGAIGRIPGFMAHRSPIALVRVDPTTEQPVRGPDGFCLRCSPDEPGEAIGAIAADGSARFEGYTDADASARKVLCDAFAAGDVWYRTGDLMKQDRQGFYVFVDRLGDTFRWKGENVSTTEVADVLAGAPGVVEAAVYGVEVQGAEGRAGMAALVTGSGFTLAALHDHAAANLPRYARPLFLRFCPQLAMTGSFRQMKVELQSAGYDPAACADPLFFDDGIGYVALDAALHLKIETGTIRL